jgi:S1-C subfamily serine protease
MTCATAIFIGAKAAFIGEPLSRRRFRTAQAGLQVGDVIQRLNGVIVRGPGFDESIAKLKPGTKVVISYRRSAWAHETLVAVMKTPE